MRTDEAVFIVSGVYHAVQSLKDRVLLLPISIHTEKVQDNAEVSEDILGAAADLLDDAMHRMVRLLTASSDSPAFDLTEAEICALHTHDNATVNRVVSMYHRRTGLPWKVSYGRVVEQFKKRGVVLNKINGKRDHKVKCEEISEET